MKICSAREGASFPVARAIENKLKINPRKLLAPHSFPAHLDRAQPFLIAHAQENLLEDAALSKIVELFRS